MRPAPSPRVHLALDEVLVVRVPGVAAAELAIVERVAGGEDLVRVLAEDPGREVLLARRTFNRLVRAPASV